jgi:hypothetical protein
MALKHITLKMYSSLVKPMNDKLKKFNATQDEYIMLIMARAVLPREELPEYCAKHNLRLEMWEGNNLPNHGYGKRDFAEYAKEYEQYVAGKYITSNIEYNNVVKINPTIDEDIYLKYKEKAVKSVPVQLTIHMLEDLATYSIYATYRCEYDEVWAAAEDEACLNDELHSFLGDEK